ncbi:hypothetical protein VNO78_06649 [Psophocarpus tetragonolobus]|uniref:Uncharacterized protein n=1 Tax=Psophocarpus tetragonolobus TaxID=3891 RepID=A0AAN9STG8_PSOTE
MCTTPKSTPLFDLPHPQETFVSHYPQPIPCDPLDTCTTSSGPSAKSTIRGSSTTPIMPRHVSSHLEDKICLQTDATKYTFDCSTSQLQLSCTSSYNTIEPSLLLKASVTFVSHV